MVTQATLRERVFVGVFLLGLLLGFFWRSLAGDRVLSAADAIFATPFFASHAPEGFTSPANDLLFDSV